jgi:hypothetical protein
MQRKRFYVELALAVLTGALTILTLITREWIEAVTGWDPDGGNGSLEWLIVVVFGVACAALSITAWRESTRTQPA